jgi:tRNA(Ile)-lysidine synthase
VQRQALRDQLQRLAAPVEFDLVERLRQLPNQPISLRPGASVYRDPAGEVHRARVSQPRFAPGEALLDLTPERGAVVFDRVRVAWRIAATRRPAKRRPAAPGRECFDADKVGPEVRLRHWRAGDRFQPIGMAQAVKLQNVFTNLKIPRAQRRTLLVAESRRRGGIFWVEGLRISECFKLDKQTRRRLKWEWCRERTGLGSAPCEMPATAAGPAGHGCGRR